MLGAADLLSRAAQLLKVSPEELESRPVEGVGALYCYQPVRGGSALILSFEDGSVLFAGSAVTYDEHVAAFVRGVRTDPSLF